MTEKLSGEELVNLVRRVFRPRPDETRLAVLVDLPDAVVPDEPAWRQRREMAASWVDALRSERRQLGMDVDLVLYRNAHRNNADLPAGAWIHDGALPDSTEAMAAAEETPLPAIFGRYPILMAVTRFSATAPLKLAARSHPIRAATMPGFTAAMVPALRLDYGEINRKVQTLKGLLDRATAADVEFRHPGGTASLTLDLRFREGHASGGLLPEPGAAGNLPSGEAYIVPYEGERDGEPSRSRGIMPVQFGDEVVVYRIEDNTAVAVESDGPESRREAELLRTEPAYGNLSELGLGVLGDYGLHPTGEILLDEKLGLHIAFGRSDHFGGTVGASRFSSPDAVVHIDRVYIPETQPEVAVPAVDLTMDDGSILALMRDGAYVLDL